MKVCVTGVMMSGKNWAAKELGLPEIGFADPLKAYVASMAPLMADKNYLRKAYQDFGQWGRGSLEIPFSAERAIGVQLARLSGAHVTGVGEDEDWEAFGHTERFWVKLLLARASKMSDCAVCDVRFQNELDELVSRGFAHIHVMCSEETRRERGGEGFDPKALENVSEQMAIGLDQKMISGEGIPGAYVLWNDDRPPYPLMQGFHSDLKGFGKDQKPEDQAA